MKHLSITYERRCNSQIVEFYLPNNLANGTPYSCALNSGHYETLHDYSTHYLDWTYVATFMAMGRRCGSTSLYFNDAEATLVRNSKLEYVWYDCYDSQVDGIIIALPNHYGLMQIKLDNYKDNHKHIAIPIWSNITDTMSKAKNYPTLFGKYDWNQSVGTMRAGFGNISMYMDLGVDLHGGSYDVMLTNTISMRVQTSYTAGQFHIEIAQHSFTNGDTPLCSYGNSNKMFTLKAGAIVASIIIPGSYDCRTPDGDGTNDPYVTSSYTLDVPDESDFINIANIVNGIRHQQIIDSVIAEYPQAISWLNNKMDETVARVDNIEVDIDGGFYSAV